MNSIHHIIRSAFVMFLLVAISISQTAVGGTRHSVGDRRTGRIEKRQPSGRRSRLRRLALQRRAEAARLAAIARQRAAEEAMRARVQSLIAKDDATGEDPEIRRVAINALGHHSGTVVVMDPKTGLIYSIVNQQWALREGFKPCSTIKLVTGLAGLNEKIIDPADTKAISDSNKVDLTRALAYSKNDYFQQVGGQVGFAKMISYARDLGLGEKTGINVQKETPGQVPSFKSGFALDRMSSHGDDFEVTAVQLATLVSAMANGGKLITPYVKHTSQEEKSTPRVRRLVNINPDSFKHMVPGMIGSVSYGSGQRAFDPQEIIVGKTGTCTEHGSWVGLFTSYAPLNDPQLAIVVIARGADGRNHFPAAVAGRIYRDLNGRFGAPAKEQIATTLGSATKIDYLAPKAPLSATEKDSADSDDEESDSADDDRLADATTRKIETPRTIWGDPRQSAASRVKPVLMPLPNRTEQTAKPENTPKASSLTAATPIQRPRRVTAVKP